MHTIMASSAREALEKARRIFAAHPEVEWVRASGEATLGGLMELSDDALIHRSGRGEFLRGRSVEQTQAAILASVPR